MLNDALRSLTLIVPPNVVLIVMLLCVLDAACRYDGAVLHQHVAADEHCCDKIMAAVKQVETSRLPLHVQQLLVRSIQCVLLMVHP